MRRTCLRRGGWISAWDKAERSAIVRDLLCDDLIQPDHA